MTNVEKRGLVIWNHMCNNVANGSHTMDTFWTEESFIEMFSENVTNTTIVQLHDSTHYSDTTTVIVNQEDALNIKLYLKSHVNRDKDDRPKYPTYLYSGANLHYIYSFKTQKEAVHMQRQMIVNSLACDYLVDHLQPRGVPTMPLEDDMLFYTKGKNNGNITCAVLKASNKMLMMDETYHVHGEIEMRYPTNAHITTADMLRCHLNDESIKYELIGVK